MSAKPLPYTPAVRAGDFIFVSGQIGLSDGEMVDGGLDAQVEQSFVNLVNVLGTQEATLANVVKTTVYLTDMNDLADMNRLYEELFLGHLPARATVVVTALPRNAVFEIEAIAHVG